MSPKTSYREKRNLCLKSVQATHPQNLIFLVLKGTDTLVASDPCYESKFMGALMLFDRQSLVVSWWLLFQMVARKFHLKVLLIFVKMGRFADAVFARSLTRLTDISLLPPFVFVWKGLNCITCKWRDLIFVHYLFIRENEQNIRGSPNEGGGTGGGTRDWDSDDQLGREEDNTE